MANARRWPIGLQSSTTGRPQGIGEVIQELTRNNIAFFSASTDSFSILTDLQNARRDNPEVPHTGNFTPTGYVPQDENAPNRYHLSVPEYGKPHSEEMARRHWDMVEQRVPIKRTQDGYPDSSPIDWDVPCIWISTWNEVRDYVGWHRRDAKDPKPEQPVDGYQGNADLIGWQAYEIGREAVKRGYRWAAFGFAGANPEAGFWEAPGVLAYLKLCHENPEHLGVALHEYALADTLLNRPDHIGRFRLLHETCDRHNLRRPVIQIKEFGWRDIAIPEDQDVAMRELIEVARMYMAHANIHGAALWTVQKWQGSGIRDKVSALIPHLRQAALDHAQPIGELALPAAPPDVAAARPEQAPARPVTVTAAAPRVSLLDETGRVTATAGLNLRSEPSTAGRGETVIDLLPLGARVNIVGRLNGWYQVQVGGKSGYLSADYVALGTPPPQPAVSPAPARRQTGFQPGMNINIGVHGPDVERLRGLSWVRFVFIAADQNRSIDEAFDNSYGPLIRQYADAGIKSLIILNHETEHGNAPWTGNDDWHTYAGHFGRAARRVAERCAPFGDDVAFQIWNEQDSGWSADRGNPNRSARGLLPEHFALVLDAAQRNIRDVAPQATVVAGGLKTGPVNGRDYLRATAAQLGGRLPVDAIAYHPYGRFVHTDPFYGRRIGRLPDALGIFKQSFPGLPLWITEIGIPGEGNVIGPEHYDNIALYMNEFVSEVANNHRDHVPVLVWFAWTDNMNQAGILTADGREKQGIYQAYLAMRARGENALARLERGDGTEKSVDDLLEAAAAAAAASGYVIATAGLNFRSEPSTAGGAGTIISVLLFGTEVNILGLENGWYHIQVGDQQGYVSADYISTVAPDGRAPATGGSSPAPPRRRRRASVIGVHGAPGGAAPPTHLWGRWTGYLQDMGVRWYKQCETSDATGAGSIFEWVLHLKRSGIEPIVRFLQSAQFPDNLEQRFVDQMRRYADNGVRWVEIGNEPNLEYEWKHEWRGRYEGQWPHGRWNPEPRMRWGNPESIERLARTWIEDATRAADAGARPAFYAFGPTDWGRDRPHGLFSSTIFTDLVVGRLAAHHRAETIRVFHERNAWIAVHVATYGKPLDYSPYAENAAKPWDMTLRGYEVVLNAFRKHFGRDLDLERIPIISTEGGVFVPDHRNRIDADRLPQNDDEHARQTLEMFRYVEQHTPLTAMCPWCLAEGHNIIGHGTEEFRDHGWFKERNGSIVPRPVLDVLRRARPQQEGELEKSVELPPEPAPAPQTRPQSTVTITLQIKVDVGAGPEAVTINVDSNVD